MFHPNVVEIIKNLHKNVVPAGRKTRIFSVTISEDMGGDIIWAAKIRSQGG